MSKIYIFGYLSLLRSESFNSTAGGDNTGQEIETIPTKLFGWQRDWSAIKDSSNNIFKIYVDSVTMNPCKVFCWANISKSEGFVNGLIKEVSASSLISLDAREVGYERVDITDNIQLYNGSLPSGDIVYTYIHPVVETTYDAVIDMNYINMGIEGAKHIDEHQQPGFFKDYMSSTAACDAVIKDMLQIFISYDGKRLYLLDTADSSTCLIHVFKNHIYKIRSNIDPYLNAPFSPNWKCRDIRSAEKGNSKTLSLALLSEEQGMLGGLFEMDERWVDIMLIRNPKLLEERRVKIIERGNWILHLIAFDLGFMKESGCYWQPYFSRLKE
jgi:hypothetical protein